MALTRWIFEDVDQEKIRHLRGLLGISQLAAAALVSRGVVCGETARRFLGCEYPLGDPLEILDMEKGRDRVRAAIEDGERIAVFGDYDVDGIMSAALMHLYLESAGADVVSLLPTRESTGYGLVPDSVDELLSLGAALIITVDNGVSSGEAAVYAKSKGADVIVCDHHKVPDTIPDAAAVIDPLRPDDGSAFKSLAGVGVALKFAAAIEGCSAEEMLAHYGYLAAIGTISDVMPLTGENRFIVQQGLDQLKYRENIGLSALIEAAGLDAERISSRDVAFVLAPRINAAGRMASAGMALEMLLTDDRETAERLAGELCELNCQRQKTEQEMMCSMGGCDGIDSDALLQPVIVLSGLDYSSGVAGIVCSRLVERYGKPVVIISVDGNEAKGSGRSVDGFSLYDAINSCGDLLCSFGGHDMAAGFTIKPERIDEFRRRVNDYCRTLAEPVPYRRISVNSEIDFSDIGETEVEELMRMAPFGAANEEPVFATLSAEIAEMRPMSEKYTRFCFKKGDKRLRAAYFGGAPDDLPFRDGDRVDIAYALSLYRPEKKKTCISVRLRAIVPAGFSGEDFHTIRLFDRLCFGYPLTEEEKRRIAPTREEIGTVYRAAQKQPLPADDRERICFRFWDMKPGRALAAVSVLRELGLLEEGAEGEKKVLFAERQPKKRNLEQSARYRELYGIRQSPGDEDDIF